jgi:membrane protein implicated in regulation of membrane protease activity
MMADWTIWFVFAGVTVALEMFTGTFYLLMIGVGLAAGGLAALAGLAGEQQFVIAAVIGIIATIALRQSRYGRISRRDAARDPNVNLDIGQTLRVDAWSRTGDGKAVARVLYRGAEWDIELEREEEAHPGMFVIKEVRGNRLIVAHVPHH